MRKVTTINLNNNAFQIDEDGYESLRRYLEDAGRALAGNPDRAEILSDLEQAIADKCRATQGAYKTVVSAEEIERIVKEMGPVQGNPQDPAAAASTHDPSGMHASANIDFMVKDFTAVPQFFRPIATLTISTLYS